MKKFFLVLTSLFVIGTSSFALDAKTLWTSYGGGLKNGSSVINAGIGLTSIFGYGVAIPPLSASYERCVLIADMLPFSFGERLNQLCYELQLIPQTSYPQLSALQPHEPYA